MINNRWFHSLQFHLQRDETREQTKSNDDTIEIIKQAGSGQGYEEVVQEYLKESKGGFWELYSLWCLVTVYNTIINVNMFLYTVIVLLQNNIIMLFVYRLLHVNIIIVYSLNYNNKHLKKYLERALQVRNHLM